MNHSTHNCQQLEERLIALHEASLSLIQETSLKSLLERIAGSASQQVPARFAAVGVRNENGEMDVFIPNENDSNHSEKFSETSIHEELLNELLHSKTAVRIPDEAQGEKKTNFQIRHPQIKSFLAVPIRLDTDNLGLIYLTDRLDGDFNSDDQRIIEMLAAYAAVAITNSRLYSELLQHDQTLTQRNENLALLNQLAVTLASSSDIDQILENALSQVMGYLNLELGEIFLRQEDSSTLRLVTHHGTLVKKIWKSDSAQIGQGVIGAIAKSGQARIMELPLEDGSELNPEMEEKCFQQVACFPLAGRKGPMGVMCVASCQMRPLDDLEKQFLSAISAWVGTAIENARLSLQGKRLAILEERERIGMDLHDGIIQSIYAVGLTLEHSRLLLKEDPDQAGKSIDQAINDLNSAIRDIRAYILDLRPRHLRNENLMQGIQRLIHEFRANTLMDVNLQGPPDSEISTLLENHAVALFHICQEALANIAKHARARHVDVVVWMTKERVLLEVHDDGRGFDPETVKSTIGHGLSNMHTRARNVGGEVDLTSEPGQGTNVLAWVPFEKK
jgi:signal transduction histidine kinase